VRAVNLALSQFGRWERKTHTVACCNRDDQQSRFLAAPMARLGIIPLDSCWPPIASHCGNPLENLWAMRIDSFLRRTVCLYGFEDSRNAYVGTAASAVRSSVARLPKFRSVPDQPRLGGSAIRSLTTRLNVPVVRGEFGHKSDRSHKNRPLSAFEPDGGM
jgi:hypothetical protein